LVGVSCSTLEIPNEEACVELTRDRATCFYTIEGPERAIDAEEWRIERVGRISLSPESFGNIRKTIEKACEMVKRCTIEDMKIITTRIDEIYWKILEESDSSPIKE